MKIKNLLITLLLLISLVSLSSCFETVEEINLNNDGSGRMTLTFNGSQSKAKLASVMKLKSVNGHKVPSAAEISSELGRTATQLRAIPGISNVKTNADFQNYIISVSFDFKDVSQINTAFSKMLTAYKIPTYNAATYVYNKNTKTFSKTYQLNPATKKQYNELKQEDKEVFKSAQYTSVYRFQSLVKTMANTKASVSASKKAVMHKTPILNIINSGASVNNSIQLQ
ncbi:MAG: hypothetical protein EOP54_09045 [Sphingobacteriales bacterium]|nr:MAG: hypothetical protein EOP54_09045 [Sphingobacteriales bacterium]